MGQIHFKKDTLIQLKDQSPKVGEQAPDFKLVDVELKEKSLQDFKGKYKVLSFVPSLDTGVCALSTKKFNQSFQNRSDVAVLVLSFDLPFAQKRWCGLEGVSHVTPLSLFRSQDCASRYGVLMKDGPIAGLCARAVFVLNPNNQIIYLEIVDELTQEPNYDKVLEKLNS